MIEVLPESDKRCKGLMGADWWETGRFGWARGLLPADVCSLQTQHWTPHVTVTTVDLTFSNRFCRSSLSPLLVSKCGGLCTGGLRLSDLQGVLGNASREAVAGQVACSARAGVRNGAMPRRGKPGARQAESGGSWGT